MPNKKTVSEEELKKNNIFNQLDLENLPEEERNNLMNLMVDTVINRVTIRTMDILDEDSKKKMDELLKQGDDKKIIAFLEKNVPDYEKMYIEESEKLREELKKVTPEIDKKIKEISKNKNK
jgi:murein L,D-transpeptidase YafK